MNPNYGFESPVGWKGGGDSKTVSTSSGEAAVKQSEKQKPQFRIAKDDSKPLLRDPILRSDPIEAEQAILRLPPFLHGKFDLSNGHTNYTLLFRR